MSDQEFMFAITLTSRDAFDGVLFDVASTVLKQLGCRASAAVGLRDELYSAIGAGAAEWASFDVRFLARPGWCDIIVFARGGEIWRTSREIP